MRGFHSKQNMKFVRRESQAHGVLCIHSTIVAENPPVWRRVDFSFLFFRRELLVQILVDMFS